MGLSEKDNLLEGGGVGIEADSEQAVLIQGAPSDEMTAKVEKGLITAEQLGHTSKTH